MQACVGDISGRNCWPSPGHCRSQKFVDLGEYRIVFSLEGVPRVSQFVGRPADMAKLEQLLLPGQQQRCRSKDHGLRGLGGMGKTQELAPQHHRRFSSVF